MNRTGSRTRNKNSYLAGPVGWSFWLVVLVGPFGRSFWLDLVVLFFDCSVRGHTRDLPKELLRAPLVLRRRPPMLPDMLLVALRSTSCACESPSPEGSTPSRSSCASTTSPRRCLFLRCRPPVFLHVLLVALRSTSCACESPSPEGSTPSRSSCASATSPGR